MDKWNIVSILGTGAIGLGFLLAFLTYRLLKQHQKNYTPVYVFEFFCFALVLVGAVLQYVASTSGARIEYLENQVASLKTELKTAKDDLSAALSELKTTRSKLDSALRKVLSLETQVSSLQTDLTKAYEVMARIEKTVPTSISNLNEVNRILTGNFCSGGKDGEPLWGNKGPTTAALSTAVIGELAGARTAIISVVPEQFRQTGKP